MGYKLVDHEPFDTLNNFSWTTTGSAIIVDPDDAGNNLYDPNGTGSSTPSGTYPVTTVSNTIPWKQEIRIKALAGGGSWDYIHIGFSNTVLTVSSGCANANSSYCNNVVLQWDTANATAAEWGWFMYTIESIPVGDGTRTVTLHRDDTLISTRTLSAVDGDLTMYVNSRSTKNLIFADYIKTYIDVDPDFNAISSSTASASATLDYSGMASISLESNIYARFDSFNKVSSDSSLSATAIMAWGGEAHITSGVTDVSATAKMTWGGSISIDYRFSLPTASRVIFYAYPLVIDNISTVSISAATVGMASASISSSSILSSRREPLMIESSSSALSSVAILDHGGAVLVSSTSDLLSNSRMDSYSLVSISSASIVSARYKPFLVISSSSTISALAVEDIDLSAGLVAHFLLNNTGNDYVNGYTLQNIGNVTHSGYGMHTDGVASQPSSYNWGGKRVLYSIWASPNETFQYYQFILGTANNTSSASSYSFFLNFHDNVLADVAGHLTNSPVFTPGVQRHIVFDANHVTGDYNWYLDGSFMGSGNSANLTSSDNGTMLGIGGFSASSTTYSRGTNTANLRIYEEEKDELFIQSLYEEGPNPRPAEIQTPTTHGLKAYYPLAGDPFDIMGNFDGTDVGNSYVQDSQFGLVANFDGGTERIDIAMNLTNQTYFGLSIWVQSDDITSDGGATIFGGSGGFELYKGYDDKLNWYNNDTSVSPNISGDHTEWNWYFVELTGSSFAFYENGQQTLSLAGSFPPNDVTYAGIGGDSDRYNIDARMRNVRLYTEKITSQDIVDIFTFESNFRDIIGISIEANLSSTSDMSVMAIGNKPGKFNVRSRTEFEVKESLLAGISIYESNSFIMSAAPSLNISSSALVGSGSTLNIKMTMTGYMRASISSSTSMSVISTTIGPILKVGTWFLTSKTNSGYGVAVAKGVLPNFSPTQCKFFDNIDDVDGTVTLVHDPISMEFSNRGYPNEINCEPHEGNDYVTVMFPHSREVAISVLTGENRPIVGSKIDSRVPFKHPLFFSADAQFLGAAVVPDGITPIEFF